MAARAGAFPDPWALGSGSPSPKIRFGLMCQAGWPDTHSRTNRSPSQIVDDVHMEEKKKRRRHRNRKKSKTRSPIVMHHASTWRIASTWFQGRSIEHSRPFLLERCLKRMHEAPISFRSLFGFARHRNRGTKGITAYLGMLKTYTSHATFMCPCLLACKA